MIELFNRTSSKKPWALDATLLWTCPWYHNLAIRCHKNVLINLNHINCCCSVCLIPLLFMHLFFVHFGQGYIFKWHPNPFQQSIFESIKIESPVSTAISQNLSTCTKYRPPPLPPKKDIILELHSTATESTLENAS